MSRRALLLALAAAFITGSAVGLIGGILFARQVLAPDGAPPHVLRLRGDDGPHRMRRGDGRRPEGPSAREMVARLTDELVLSDAQAGRILALITESRRSVQAERDSLHARILRELDAAQAERFRALPRPHRFGPPHPMHGPPPGDPPGRDRP